MQIAGLLALAAEGDHDEDEADQRARDAPGQHVEIAPVGQWHSPSSPIPR
jgi:hypothetical protein